MSAEPIRCTMPHPDNPRRVCRGRLADIVPGSVEARPGHIEDPGCALVLCRRCGTKWTLCPARKVAA